ncbi:uncharacterized protein [Palaemon carinicauda]|uniref:uncharacterized protein n=1 Tax=Palaemon carinicauda TaxID=392227 RepID=UPI0035B647EC
MHGQQGCVPRFLSLPGSGNFVLALRRLCATHGALSFITSDNHQTFKTASNLLQGLYEEDEVQPFLRKTGTEWRFQMPRAPWKGGFFERLIGVTKRTHQIALGKKYLPDAHVLTLVKEAEAVVNNRPLIYSGDKCEDEVLTPSHFVRGNPIHLMAPILPDDHLNATFTSRRLRDSYFKLTDSLKAFRERWRKEYLSALRARHDCRSGTMTTTERRVRTVCQAGLPGIVETSGDNQEVAQATTFRQPATEVLDSDANSDNNAVSERSESETGSETTGA